MLLNTLVRSIGEPPARLRTLGLLEGCVNDGNQQWDMRSQLPPEFAAGASNGFGAPFAWASESQLVVFRANPGARLQRFVFTDGRGRFVWHPAMPAPAGYKQSGVLPVWATSSSRTLGIAGLEPHGFVKTHLGLEHFRYARVLLGKQVRHSVEVSADLGRICPSDGAWAFLPESIGLAPADDPEEGVGVLYREALPRPLALDPRQLVPTFSMHSIDRSAPDDPPLLVQIIQRFGAGDPLGYFMEEFAGRIQDTWIDFAHHGLLPELHGQNTLFEIDLAGRPRRVVFRDFQGVVWDPETRARCGLSPIYGRELTGSDEVRQMKYSVRYDHFIGRYVFVQWIRAFILAWPEYTFEEVATQIALRFQRLAGEASLLLPRNVTYCFDRTQIVGPDEDDILRRANISPLFR